MRHWIVCRAMLRKEWLSEWRSGNLIIPTVFLALVITFIFSFSFEPNALAPNVAGNGAFWIALIVSVVLGVGRNYGTEREMGAWQGVVRMVTSPRGVLTAKITWFLLMSLVVSFVLMPVLDLIYHTSFLSHLLTFLPGLLLCLLGVSVVGATFGIMLAQTRAKEMLFALIVFPLITPLLLLSAKAGGLALADGELAEQLFYLKLLGAADLVLLFIAYWSVEQLLDI